jgi:hypothetical protein
MLWPALEYDRMIPATAAIPTNNTSMIIRFI